MCNFWLNFCWQKITLQLHSGGQQQLPIVPKIGVHSSWSGEKVVRKKIVKKVFRCVILAKFFSAKNLLCSFTLAASSSFELSPK